MTRLRFAAPLAVVLLASCTGLPQRPPPAAARGVGPSAALFVVRRGWHIDIGFAADDLGAPLEEVRRQFPDARYVFFGFGDEHYLLARGERSMGLLGAIWPGPGIVLATAIQGTPAEAFGAPYTVTLEVTAAQVQAAQAFVWRSLWHTDGAARVEGPGPYGGSLYFSSGVSYSGAHTCNTWAAEGLRAAAVPVRSAGVIFAGQLWRQVRRLERKPSAGAGAPALSLRTVNQE
jgi:hypothetical protein